MEDPVIDSTYLSYAGKPFTGKMKFHNTEPYYSSKHETGETFIKKKRK